MADKKQPAPDPQPRSILINFVLDRSGSMESIREATISGFNEFKNGQAAEDGEAYFTLTLFDTEFDTVCHAVPIREVSDLDRSTFQPRGMTALFDAVGHTMGITDDFVAANKPDQVIFVIMTDGGENSSREFSGERISQMIADRQNLAQYEFIYLGANQDSYEVASGMGVRNGRTLDYAASDEGSRMAMKRASANVTAHRRHGTKMSKEFFSPHMENLGAIAPDAWKQMTPEERQGHLDGDEGAQT